MGARAVVLSLAGRVQAASEAAGMAAQMAERLHYPLSTAAALEARGVATADPAEGARLLEDARDAWTSLERPLEAARSQLLAGRRLAEAGDDRGAELVAHAAAEAERLGVPHLAERARLETL
jgi:hypothetical protein